MILNESFDKLSNYIDTNLNSSQKEAVKSIQGALLVIAGAGSGKTRVITTRIAYLLSKEASDPLSIVALTFTNKAAQEMKERIYHYLGDQIKLPFVGTFHGYCLRLLKQYGYLHNLELFTIIDSDDQQKMIHDILKRNNLHKQFNVRQISYQISQLKNKIDGKESITHPLILDIYKTYEHEKKLSKLLDFDDLLIKALELFKYPEFKIQYQKTITHILIDEYQDTNQVQHALLKEMVLNEGRLSARSICAVGDADQSIYSWRGATIANMLNFQKDFTPTKVIKIEQNYRSVQSILDIANEIIINNSNRNNKKLWSDRQGSSRVHLFTCLSEYQEAEIMARIATIVTQKKANNCAILYRTHAQSRAIEEALIKRSVPYTIIGGIQFYERKEIKDLLAYLRILVNPYDFISLLRIINCPHRGIGPKTEELLYQQWEKESSLTYDIIIERTVQKNNITGLKAKQLHDFVELLQNVSCIKKPGHALEEIIRKTSYISFIKDSYESQEAESRLENIKELLHAISYLESQGIETITEFLHEVALIQNLEEKQNKKEEPRVLLMTLHAAKGLEFHTVLLIGIEETLFPSSRSLQDDDALEEERRLLYVGITRAQEYLIFSHAQYRYTYGQMTEQTPSRFLAELPKKQISKLDCTQIPSYSISRFIEQLYGYECSILESKSAGMKQEEKYIAVAVKKSWKKNQPVIHATFGMGIIEDIQYKGDACYITVKFKQNSKMILDQFLKAL